MGFFSSFFTVVLIYIVVIAVYFFVRLGINFSRGMRGFEAVPHIQSFRNLFSSCSRRGTYEEIR